MVVTILIDVYLLYIFFYEKERGVTAIASSAAFAGSSRRSDWGA
jgi:hypothetical protein